MEFKIGKLYKCSDHLLMIYPTRENAAAAAQAEDVPATCEQAAWAVAWCSAAEQAAAAAVAWAARYWSEELNCTVCYSEPDEIFIFIKEEIIEEHKYLNVLFGDKQGWIICKNWLRIERIV